MRFTTKTVKLCHSAPAQLRVYFKFRLTSELLTIRLWRRLTLWSSCTTDPTWLCSFFVSAAFCDSFSLFHCTLCHDSYMPQSVRPNTDRFMTGWFLAMLWVSLSTCLLRSGVGSASAGASLLLSSVLRVPEWTVLQTWSLKNIFQKYHCKRSIFKTLNYIFLYGVIIATCLVVIWFTH